MGLYSTYDHAELRRPLMIMSLSGWVDAGGAGTGAAKVLTTDMDLIAEFDTDALFDYRANRPVLHLEGGEVKTVTWPSLDVRLLPGEDRDVVVFSGMEPDFGWKRLATSVAELATGLAVRRLVTLGAVPAAVPHTLPVPVLTTTSDSALLLAEDELLEGTLVVPGAAVSIITNALVDAGIPAIGYWAQVPHYVQETYHPAVAALLRRTAQQTDLVLDLTGVDQDASDQVERLDEIVAGRPEAAAYLERLEQIAGEGVPTADEIGAEVERFLRDQGDEGPFG
jgi:hypothetical protein